MSGSKDTNPLLDFTALPRFSAIQPKHIEPALDQLLAENRAGLEQLFSSTPEATWNNFIQPFEDMKERLERMWSPVAHLNAVKDSNELRTVYDRCLPKLSDYSTELGQDERLYRVFKSVKASPDFAQLSLAQKKIIDNSLRDFRLSGAELDSVKKKRFKEIEQELTNLNNEFAKNVLDATQAWQLLIVDESDLAGLPSSAIDQAKQAAEQVHQEGWRFTLDAPSYLAFMTYADNQELRRQMYEAYMCRASDQGPDAGRWDNGAVIARQLMLKQEKAMLLGYNNYAEYSLERKMAATPQEVLDFIYDLAQRSKVTAEKEFEELKIFASEIPEITELQAWDVMYCSEKLRKRDYDLSQEDLRPYFPLPQVLEGMFDVVHRLYGISIMQAPNVDVWHKDVEFFEIKDETAKLRGSFYVDLFAREHKRGGAWMAECVSRKKVGDRVQSPVAYLTCNFSAPIADQSSLLTHQEVITLFHEFGHGLHHMLTQVNYVSVSGINGVEWDAVELPSQFMENWCWQRESVALFGKHYQTGEMLPLKLHEKMMAARYFQSGMKTVRQLEFALFDMRVHTESIQTYQAVQDCLNQVRKQVAVMMPPDFSRFQNSFTHIFSGGYAAGYYSYKWAEVLSADAFSKFEESGIFDRETGHKFLQTILEKGGTQDAMTLFMDFQGRRPSINALLRHSGLAA